MKIYKYICLNFLFINFSWAISSNDLIKQGDITLTFADIDGYSYSMPADMKSGFFDSPKRLDTTLNTMITMKHVVHYGESNNLLDKNLINENVSSYLTQNFEMILQSKLNDLEFIKLKKYLTLKFSYRYMQKHINDSVKDNELFELAQEEYLINKQQYYNHEHIRDIKYINVKYNDSNKSQQLQLAQTIQQQLRVNNLDFDKTSRDYVSNKDIEFIKGINGFPYKESYKSFSDFVFKPTKTGLIDDIQDAKNRFTIAVIIKITPEGYIQFNDVKDTIVKKLKKDKVTRKFADLVLNLTTDPIEVNEDAIITLRTRYLQQNSQD